jgi:hypothetical protein
MAVPTSDKRLRIADEFDICKMPNCKGSIDGKHCCIKCPSNAASLYFNYKSFHSINLLGVADASFCFTLMDVGALGREKDSSVAGMSSFGTEFIYGDLNVTAMGNIQGTSITYHIVLCRG